VHRSSTYWSGLTPKVRHGVGKIEAAKASNFNKRTIDCSQQLAKYSISIT
jgi:hypothetical protein